MKRMGKSAWIVEWHPHRDDIGMSDLTPAILPRSWGKTKVLDFMRITYWNSPLHYLFETQNEFTRAGHTGFMSPIVEDELTTQSMEARS